MREGTSGLLRRGGLTLGAGLLAATAVVLWPTSGQEAAAADRTVPELVALARDSNRLRSAAALERLRKLGTPESRKALVELADSDDPQLAMATFSALGRLRDSDARRAIELIYEDQRRSDLTREMALTVWCDMRAREGAKWQDMRSYLEAHADNNTRLLDAADAVHKARIEQGAK
jgi:hypothetical protein